MSEPHSTTRWAIILTATSLAVGSLMAALLPALMGIDEGGNSGSAQGVGVSNARNGDEMPLYELPPVFVVADRKAELAKIQVEEQLDRVRQTARSKPAAKPPA